MADSMKHYPPIGDKNRFDAITSRGRAMRRRRQTALGMGAGSLVAAFAAFVVVVSGGSTTPDSQVVADRGDNNARPTDVTQAQPKSIEASVGQDGSKLRVEVVDPAMPVPESGAVDGTSYRPQQCALVRVADSSGVTAAEGFACNALTAVSDGDRPVDLDLQPASGVELGCAAVNERVDAGTMTTVSNSSTFNMVIPPELAPGHYDVTATVTSGFGDGCPNEGHGDGATASTDESGQTENVAIAKGSFTVSP